MAAVNTVWKRTAFQGVIKKDDISSLWTKLYFLILLQKRESQWKFREISFFVKTLFGEKMCQKFIFAKDFTPLKNYGYLLRIGVKDTVGST
jgi:hypothetical protein